MTSQILTKQNRIGNISLISILCILLMPIMLFFSESIKRGAMLGLDLSLGTIIPTLFPFFILSDLWVSYATIKGGIISKAYGRLFGVSGSSLPAYLLGSLCGFPLGIKAGVGLYERGYISKDELERLSGFANNPSAAFVISGIGAGLYKDIAVGTRLYIAVLISSFLVGLLFRSKGDFFKNNDVILKQRFDLIKSIQSAGFSSLTVSCYIVFFSSVIGLLTEITKNPLILAIASSFLEITNASSISADLVISNPYVKYVITAFALGFSGLSVHMQVFALLPAEISKSKYLLMKLIQGILCSIIMFLFKLI